MMRSILVTMGLILLTVIDANGVDKARLRWVRSKPQIDSIAIEGNQYFTRAAIKKQMYSHTRNFWLALKGDRRSRVQRETLGRDTLEIKYMYLTNGFLAVRIQHDIQPLEPDSTAIVRINITENKQFRYGPTELEGNYDRQFHWRLKHIIDKLGPGQPVNLFELKDTETAIKAFLANRGYPLNQVRYQIDTTGHPNSCPVTFEVHSDSLVHFGNVTIAVTNPLRDSESGSATPRYPDYASRRELKIVPGAIYRRDDILESQRRLFESGYFTTFLLSRSEDASVDRLNPDFVLGLTERKSEYMTYRMGAAQSEVRDLEWDMSAGFGKRNFFQSRALDISGRLSFSAGSDTRLLENLFRLRLVEPWILGTRTKLALSWEWEPTLTDPITDEFDKRVWSASVLLTKWYGRKLRVNFGSEYENVKLSGIIEGASETVRDAEGKSGRRKLFMNVRRDSRNDLFIPSRGSVTELSGDFYGGFMQGDADFFKIQGSWSRYRRVWPGWIFATRLRGEWAEEFGQTEAVPVDEAIYLGGASTVRGFEENHLGPIRDIGTPDETHEGARYTVVFNQEFRWRTVQFLNVLPFVGGVFKRFPQWQTIFVDVGNGFRNKEEMRFENLAVTYGMGFQIASPAGPIRIDYAEVLEHDDFDFAHRWHFTILYAF